MRYSIIVPVFNRPDEVDELLESLSSQTLKDFEVVIVEDGSQIPCKDVCDKYANILDLHYYFKENSGPGQSRNYGVERAQGEYVIILDSDAVTPPGFMQAIDDELKHQPTDAWGGPDAAHESFSDIQKAISYAMTSFFTTGGIRGGKKQLDKKFYPRSFNLGVRREVYQQLGGFTTERFASIRTDTAVVCSLRLGCGTNAVRISVSSGDRSITAAMPASTSGTNILKPSSPFTLCRQSLR